MTHSSLLIPVYVPTFLLAFAQGLLVPTLPLYVQSLGYSFAPISFVVAAAGLGTVLADLPTGMLLERIGRKPAMVVGTASLAICTLALAFTAVYPELIALRLAAGVGTALWGISRLAYLTDVVPVAQRGRVLSSFGGVSRVGTFGGPAVGGLVASQFGLEAPLYLTAAIVGAVTVIAVFYIHEPREPAASWAAGHRWRLMGDLLRQHSRELATAGAAQVFAQMIRSGRQIIVPLYGASVIGLDVVQVGTIVSISAAVDMSLFLPAGQLMDRFGRKYAAVPSFAIMAVGMALLPFTLDFTGLLLATTIMGLGNGLGAGTMMTLGADLSPKGATGEFLGLWRLIGDSGAAAGPSAVGAIADVLGLGVAAAVLAAIGLFAAGTLSVFVRETRGLPDTREDPIG